MLFLNAICPRALSVRGGLLPALVCILLPAWCSPGSGQEASRDLVVGTKVAEPFAIRDADGGWRGISIELWESIAGELGWSYEYREVSLGELVTGVSGGSLDLAVAAVTATAERETEVDFTYPFYSTGLGIAVPARPAGGLVLLRRLFSPDFLTAIALLSVVLLGVGVVVWLLERRGNPSQFGGKPLQGIGSGFWWSAVTMTTVGYGDKAPATFWGRAVGLAWMFAGIITISTFTAAITTALTVTRLHSKVQGPGDLVRVRVGTLAGSAPEASLRNRQITPRAFDSLEDAMAALKDGRLDAVVYDAPILRYRVKQGFQGDLHVLPQTFDRQDYAIVLQPGSPLREPLNRALLRETRSRRWQDLLDRYLGR